jgi:hypothetical protein
MKGGEGGGGGHKQQTHTQRHHGDLKDPDFFHVCTGH